MRVPGGVGVGRPGDASDARACLDQATRQENALAINIAAIGIADCRRLLIELERLAGGRGSEQVKGFRLKSVHVLENAVVLATAIAFEKLDETLPCVQPVQTYLRAGRQLEQSETGSVGVAEHEER